MARAPASSLCMLALSACQTVFGIDETGTKDASGVSSSNSGGSSTVGSGAAGASSATGDAAGGGGSAGGSGGQAGGTVLDECAPSAAGTDLLGLDGGVENGIAPADEGWNEFSSALSETSIVHSGNHAALLCATTANQEYFSAYIDVPGPMPAVGDRFVASGCVRSHPNHMRPVKALVRLREQTGSKEYEQNSPDLTEIDDVWRKIETPVLEVTDTDSYLITVHVLGWDMLDDVCIVFDDIHVVQLP